MLGGFMKTVFAVGDAIVDALEPSKPKRAPDSPITIAKRHRTIRRKKEIRATLKAYRLNQVDQLARAFKEEKEKLGVIAMSGNVDEMTVSFREMNNASQSLEQALQCLGGEKIKHNPEAWCYTLRFLPLAQSVTAISRSVNETYEIWPCLDSDHRYSESSDDFLKALTRVSSDVAPGQSKVPRRQARWG